MGGNNEFVGNFERNKNLKKLPSMQRVKSMMEDCCIVSTLIFFVVNLYFCVPSSTIQVLLVKTICSFPLFQISAKEI